MTAVVSCGGDDSVTNTAPDSNGDAEGEQLQTQWADPLTLHRFEVEWLSELNESYEATLEDEYTVTITADGEGFFYLLVPDIEPGRYAVTFTDSRWSALRV